MKSFFELLSGVFSLFGAIVIMGVVFAGIFAALALVPVFILAVIGIISWSWLGFTFLLLSSSLLIYVITGAIGNSEDD